MDQAWYMVCIGCAFTMNAQGMGIHADLVNPSKIVLVAKWLVAAEVFYAWNLGWTKLAVLLMYYRVFRIPFFKRMTWIIGSFVIAWVICVTFLFIFICVPVEKLWYPDVPGRCIDQVGTWIANAASTLLTDLLILLLPIRQIWVLQLRSTAKIGLTLAFGLGFLYVDSSQPQTHFFPFERGKLLIEYDLKASSSHLPTARAFFSRIAILTRPTLSPLRSDGHSSRCPQASSQQTCPLFFPLLSI